MKSTDFDRTELEAAARPFAKELESHTRNVQRVSLRVIRDGGTPADVAKRAQEMFDRVSHDLYRTTGVRTACATGCAFCCVVPVETFSPEVDLLIRELRNRLGPDGMGRLKSRIQAVIDGRMRGNRPRCALLGPDDRCTVYDVRPMFCRSCNALDAEPCKEYEATGDETPRDVVAFPLLFASHTHLATNTAIDPQLTPDTYPEPVELMGALLRRL